MIKVLTSDIGHSGNKGEDKKLDMKLNNLESMKRKSETFMTLQKKSFVAELDKRQKTWVREHTKRASKINKQAKQRKQSRMTHAEEDAKRIQETLKKEDAEKEDKLKPKEEPPKIEKARMLQRRKSILPSLDDIAEPVQTPPPNEKENKSDRFKRLAKAIGLSGVNFAKTTKVQGYEDEWEEDDSAGTSLFKRKVRAALMNKNEPEKLSFSSLVLKLKENKERLASLPPIAENAAKSEKEKLEQLEKEKFAKMEEERQKRIAENQKLPPLLRKGSKVNSILKEAEENEERLEKLRREQSILSGPEPVFISESLPEINLGGKPQLNKQQLAAKRRRRSRRKKGVRPAEDIVADPLNDDRFLKLQYMLKPELRKKKDDSLGALTSSVLHAKKYARWWRAHAMNAGVIHEE